MKSECNLFSPTSFFYLITGKKKTVLDGHRSGNNCTFTQCILNKHTQNIGRERPANEIKMVCE